MAGNRIRQDKASGDTENDIECDDSSTESPSPSDVPCEGPSPSPLAKNSLDHGHDRGERRSGDEQMKEQSMTRSPEKWDSMNGDQIRQNARELLLSSPYRPVGGATPSVAASVSYQSYHDSNPNPSSNVAHTPVYYEFTRNDMADGRRFDNESQDETDANLSVSHVASLAFNCVSHCLTESYRAASNYYGGPPTQYSQYSLGNSGSYQQNYQNVTGYYSDNCDGDSAGNDGNRGNDASCYIDAGANSYQQKEIMERSIPRPPPAKAFGQTAAEHTSEGAGIRGHPDQKQQSKHSEQAVLLSKGEFAPVHLPSTYQGGSRVMGAI